MAIPTLVRSSDDQVEITGSARAWRRPSASMQPNAASSSRCSPSRAARGVLLYLALWAWSDGLQPLGRRPARPVWVLGGPSRARARRPRRGGNRTRRRQPHPDLATAAASAGFRRSQALGASWGPAGGGVAFLWAVMSTNPSSRTARGGVLFLMRGLGSGGSRSTATPGPARIAARGGMRCRRVGDSVLQTLTLIQGTPAAGSGGLAGGRSASRDWLLGYRDPDVTDQRPALGRGGRHRGAPRRTGRARDSGAAPPTRT